MLKILLSEKLPYFFTALMALASYQLNTIVGLEVNAPTLVYHIKTINEKESGNITEKVLECEIKNINLTKSFRDLTIHIQFRNDVSDSLPRPALVLEPSIVPISPSTIVIDTMITCIDGIINEYKISSIQPNSSYILKLKTKENNKINEYPKLYLYSDNDVRLIKRGMETFLVEHQILLNIVIFTLCVAGIGFYLNFIFKQNNT